MSTKECKTSRITIRNHLKRCLPTKSCIIIWDMSEGWYGLGLAIHHISNLISTLSRIIKHLYAEGNMLIGASSAFRRKSFSH